MLELCLIQIRDIQIEILNLLDDFCKKNDINYFLCNGTLLGAVKYKGYIPWDDDIDVCLLRDDYEKLIDLFNKKNINNQYKLFSLEYDKNYYFPFAKLVDTNTVLIEKNVNNGVELGVNIDIFPIDSFGNTEEEVNKRFKKFKSLRRKLNFSKLNDFSSSCKLKSFLKRIFSFPYKIKGPEYFCKKIDTLAKSFTTNTQYVGNCVWGFYGIGEAHKTSVFSQILLGEFEGKQYSIPIGFKDYLFGLYGDYREDPPVEKQCTHHSFKAYLKDY